jgi:hypothetical protein
LKALSQFSAVQWNRTVWLPQVRLVTLPVVSVA